ncbi:uncharacterized protein EI90DRAFT_3135873 [Cantharellus anzutake]|uniref:uncharacterized protein n=1 Tax=Cantharellus anzutake TaxID=1750568 RepID=UPI0019081009|nr:uncharacterized protein EI90DRAFT_3135873 [Cantharellus anzutake]KAF8314591.1 hypothetical protein EI90DRAFT_3135873 [Cantharellus anzutake]
MNHIRKSPGCLAKFQEHTAVDVQATPDKSDDPSTSQEEGDSLIQAGSSSPMEVDPELYSSFGLPATNLAQAVDDPPPDSDDESNMESVSSDLLPEDEESDREDGIGSEDPFTAPLGGIDTEERGFSYEKYEAEGPNPHLPWANLSEWRLVEWLVDQQLSQRAIDDFIKNCWTQEHPKQLSFGSAKEMYNKFSSMDGAPAWHAKEVILSDAPTEPQILFYRDVRECSDHIQNNPSFSNAWDYEPQRFTYSDMNIHVFHEPCTGKLWWRYQEESPEGTMIQGVILASDETHLTNFSGSKVFHAVYMTLANIHGDIRC